MARPSLRPLRRPQPSNRAAIKTLRAAVRPSVCGSTRLGSDLLLLSALAEPPREPLVHLSLLARSRLSSSRRRTSLSERARLVTLLAGATAFAFESDRRSRSAGGGGGSPIQHPLRLRSVEPLNQSLPANLCVTNSIRAIALAHACEPARVERQPSTKWKNFNHLRRLARARQSRRARVSSHANEQPVCVLCFMAYVALVATDCDGEPSTTYLSVVAPVCVWIHCRFALPVRSSAARKPSPSKCNCQAREIMIKPRERLNSIRHNSPTRCGGEASERCELHPIGSLPHCVRCDASRHKSQSSERVPWKQSAGD